MGGICAQSWQRKGLHRFVARLPAQWPFLLFGTSSGGSPPLSAEIGKRTTGMVAGSMRYVVDWCQAGFLLPWQERGQMKR